MKDADMAQLPGYLSPGRRPRCRNCGKPLPPQVAWKFTTREVSPGEVRTEQSAVNIRGYGYRSGNKFCTLRCGYRYACVMVNKEETRAEQP